MKYPKCGIGGMDLVAVETPLKIPGDIWLHSSTANPMMGRNYKRYGANA
jgi:hypothetical protein